MKRRIRILAGLTLLTAFISYASGRWGFFLPLPPVLIPAFLSLLAAVWVLLPCRDGGPFWKRWLIRLAALAGCWLFLRLPSYMDDGYLEMGRRAHIRSLFTPELITELREAVSKLSARKDERGNVRVTAADLPPAVCATTWGEPGGASCGFNEQDGLQSVTLTWGSALTAHHGFVISDEEIPFHGFGYHITKHGQDIVYYPERYYPLYPGSYIFIDEN
jgi:hypothetical protein